MVLSSLETKAEQKCLIDYNKCTNFKISSKIFPTSRFNQFSADLKGMGSYWVSATARKCLKNYLWCTGSKVDFLALTDNYWANLQPNLLPGQDCMAITLTVPKVGIPPVLEDYGLNDWECVEAIYYLCEAQ